MFDKNGGLLWPLPVLSRTLDGVLPRNPKLSWQIHEDDLSCSLLETAVRLRHSTLFKDCLILSMGPWHDPAFKTLKDPKLKNLAQNVYNGIAAEILAAHATLTASMARGEALAKNNP